MANLDTEIAEEATSARPPRNYCWIPTTELAPGMVIARPVFGGQGRLVTIHLAVGSAITANTIGQLINKGIECIAVMQDAPPDAATHARIVELYEARLHEIFGPTPDENCQPLLEALLIDGPCPC
jgi:hypothetical protein